MSSTRNINTPGNYCLQQQQFKNSSIYTLYPTPLSMVTHMILNYLVMD